MPPPHGDYSSPAYKAQILFQKYRTKRLSEKDLEPLSDRLKEVSIRFEWRKLIHEQLYSDPRTRDDKALEDHPYLTRLLPVIRKASININYNFDNTLERLVQRHREQAEQQKTLGFESFWVPRLYFREDRTPIYHPNGFLPVNLFDKHSEQIVLSEDEFANQLVDVSSSHYQFLYNNIARNTCLLIGLSLDDNTLKNVLRQNAKSNPGNDHYYIYFVEDPAKKLSDDEQGAIADANFEIYNLITMFLTKEDIGLLGELLKLAPPERGDDADHFEELCTRIESRFVFYIVGCVASGKTSILSNFRNTYVFDEWLESRIEEIIKSSDELTVDERRAADNWVAKQVRMKNANLSREKSGIYFIDRAPLDAFAFTPKDGWKDKAEFLENEVCKTKPRMELQHGHVFLLEAEPSELELRMRLRGRPGTRDYLEKQQECLSEVYSGTGVTRVDTRGQSLEAVVKYIAQKVFREDYIEFDMSSRLQALKSRGGT